MIKEKLNATGELTLTLNGEVVHRTTNVVVDTGKKWLAQCMSQTPPTETMGYMAIGIVGTDEGNTGLTAILMELDRKFCISTVTNNVVTYSASWGEGQGVGSIQEAGIFNQDDILISENNIMLARTVFPSGVINKSYEDEFTISWAITIN